MLQNFRGPADSVTLSVRSYEVKWYLFWYKWIEDVHAYTLLANIGLWYQAFSTENPGRGCNNPPLEDVLQQIPQEDEG